jgi:glycosyltransferase involved in cell wall biosynthesis
VTRRGSVSHSARLRFCLVTSAHVCNNPRLVKEADALHDAGHDVRVVAVWTDASNAARDDALIRARRWRLHRVRVARHERASHLRWLAASLAQAAARGAFDRGVLREVLRDQAASRFVRHLARAATVAPADVFVGHNLEALPAAVRAARAFGAHVGFDLEDLHSGELPDDPSAEMTRRLIVAVERRYLPECDFLIASSDGIADEVAARYGVTRPHVVHNVFPSSDRLVPVPQDRRGDGVSLYWYSQVIGAGRGLEEAVTALSMLPRTVRLHVRGRPDQEYVTSLVALAHRLGVHDRLHILAPAAPDTLVALAGHHDIGLALEQPTTLNRRLCLTNKLFTYLLGGIPVAATDTPGQQAIMSQLPGAGFTYPSGDAASLAHQLAPLVDDRNRLEAAKRAAYDHAVSRFCWDHERLKLLDALTMFAPRPPLEARTAS